MTDNPTDRMAYRGVVWFRKRDGKFHCAVSRCYDRSGPAKAWVTRTRKDYSRGAFVSGSVQYAIAWKDLED